MSRKVTLGGERLGSGKKQKVELHGFERSTHDLGYVWRNTQAPGTLVPFMTMLALPGDTFDINLGADVKTHPTLGPLFASFKLQLDVFECPIRLYHSWLHNNKLKIGNDMSKVKLPQIAIVEMNDINFSEDALLPIDMQQVNPSSIMAYLGIRGFGQLTDGGDIYKNALPFLGYWDIYKNYYANKQEEIGAVIHYDDSNYLDGTLLIKIGGTTEFTTTRPYNFKYEVPSLVEAELILNYDGDTAPEEILVVHYKDDEPDKQLYTIYEPTVSGTPNNWVLLTYHYYPFATTITGVGTNTEPLSDIINKLNIKTFDLEQIDKMREAILAHDNIEPFWIEDGGFTEEPYNLPLKLIPTAYSRGENCMLVSQEGLALKTYQSDIFNNWLNTEWIDGEGGINEITAVNTEEGSFDINTLNLAQKVYDMLNRIAVSGGTYEDWLEAVYDHESFRRAETPMYHGGLSKEIIFQEVVSTAGAEQEGNTEPLGTLAGRGKMSDKHKGGQVTIKVNEPSYIIGIVSITPRIDYYQGNEFWTNHTTMNDLHKPSLDEIGFQDLVTDKMAFWDTVTTDGVSTYKSAGKQPAWLDYMTNYNKLYGNFADERNEMFMTLARRYEPDRENKTIKDLTSYIDPTKFNYAFAQTDLTAMNFWVQIGCDIIARRKMSAKVMPNL